MRVSHLLLNAANYLHTGRANHPYLLRITQYSLRGQEMLLRARKKKCIWTSFLRLMKKFSYPEVCEDKPTTFWKSHRWHHSNSQPQICTEFCVCIVFLKRIMNLAHTIRLEKASIQNIKMKSKQPNWKMYVSSLLCSCGPKYSVTDIFSTRFESRTTSPLRKIHFTAGIIPSVESFHQCLLTD